MRSAECDSGFVDTVGARPVLEVFNDQTIGVAKAHPRSRR
jgi:hypothetical protein